MALFNSLESWVDLIDFDFHYSNLIKRTFCKRHLRRVER